LNRRRNCFGPATPLSNIWCFQVGPKVEFVRWVWRLILVRNVSISMDPYSIEKGWVKNYLMDPNMAIAVR